MLRSATLWVLLLMAIAAAAQLPSTPLTFILSMIILALHINAALVILLLLAVYFDSKTGKLPRFVGYLPVLAALGYLIWFASLYIANQNQAGEIKADLEALNNGRISQYEPGSQDVILRVRERDVLIRYRLDSYYQLIADNWLHESIKPIAACEPRSPGKYSPLPRDLIDSSFGRPRLSFCVHQEHRPPTRPQLVVLTERKAIQNWEGETVSYVVQLDGEEVGRYVVAKTRRMLPIPVPIIGCGLGPSSWTCFFEFHSYYDEGPPERDIIALMLGLEPRSREEMEELSRP